MKQTIGTVLFLCVAFGLSAQPDIEKQLQTEFIMVENGGVIQLPPGKIVIAGSLVMTDKANITIQGAGKDQTILSFANQQRGAEGIKITNSQHITLQNFTIQDTKGDAIKVQETDGIAFLDVRVEWTGRPNKNNGAYGLYPVQCKNVLIDGCEAIGASDAGIYVGQSHQIVVRNSRAYRNVAGIEIENSTMADVYNNTAEGNTGGILVFDLPGLIKKKGGNVRVYDNLIQANNYKNFAPKGNTVAEIPPGTGLMVMATSDVEAFNNKILDNKTVGAAIVSYLFTENKYEDDQYNPYPARIAIHDNEFRKKNGKMKPTWKHKMGVWLQLKFGRKGPNILYDGIVAEGARQENGMLKDEYRICVRDNINGTFLNLQVSVNADLKAYDTNATPFNCEIPALEPAKLATN